MKCLVCVDMVAKILVAQNAIRKNGYLYKCIHFYCFILHEYNTEQ